ncbi:hypothetical protein W02_11420 [Nitrospira sp. KM1]|uniref:hypothetical protein n=1 Tax=Nitrospira sp. KM1 TaxID=1936990 RepID=UPI0013A78CED|nr:hypothetical protein [Nitrospira sp. KM1]BCA54002.1 hypothetical protein W02_11420 [Nitrospira sp. KM1]
MNRRSPTRLAALVLVSIICPAQHSVSAGSLERVTVQLDGPSCLPRHDIISALSTLPGIHLTDISVPDHLLIDIDPSLLDRHQALANITGAIGSPGCRIQPMQSCISASFAASVRPATKE